MADDISDIIKACEKQYETGEKEEKASVKYDKTGRPYCSRLTSVYFKPCYHMTDKRIDVVVANIPIECVRFYNLCALYAKKDDSK